MKLLNKTEVSTLVTYALKYASICDNELVIVDMIDLIKKHKRWLHKTTRLNIISHVLEIINAKDYSKHNELWHTLLTYLELINDK